MLLSQLALGHQLNHEVQAPVLEPLPGHSAAAAAANVRRGVVHHLTAAESPPPMHDDVGVVYIARYEDDLWYVGETQYLRKRRRQHMYRRGKQQLEMWYVLMGQQQNRKQQQGFLTKALVQAGFPMLSTYDAHFARKK